MKLTIGFSPCPNDTFIFDALVHQKIDTQGLEFEFILEDVETLNLWAEEGRLDVTKLSYNAFLRTVSDYALLRSGSALGNGVGPLLVTRKENYAGPDKEEPGLWLKNARIAIPGKNTTANLLLSLALPEAENKTELLFSEIENEVLSGNFDAGLIIHENRFTYREKGLAKLIDLGDWWEQETNAPIPLGGIVIKRNIDKAVAEKLDALIKESLRYSWNLYPELSSFITSHAQEMEEDVMRKHIELYVNDFTADLGTEGVKAVEMLFLKGKETGLTDRLPDSVFY